MTKRIASLGATLGVLAALLMGCSSEEGDAKADDGKTESPDTGNGEGDGNGDGDGDGN